MGSERTRELRRRRHRKKQVNKLLQRAENGNPSEKAVVVAKLRRLTPGASTIIADRGLEQ